MGENENDKQNVGRKSLRKRLHERPRHRWGTLKKQGVKLDQTQLSQDRFKR